MRHRNCALITFVYIYIYMRTFRLVIHSCGESECVSIWIRRANRRRSVELGFLVRFVTRQQRKRPLNVQTANCNCNCKLPICMAPLTPPQSSGRLTRHSIMVKLIKIVKNRGLWTHHKCVSPRLTENELTDYSTSSDKFICPPCIGRQLGYPIDFARSLHRYVSISYSYKHMLTYIFFKLV